ncbi:MAG TPA: AarF/UbiB family protein [Anaerolineae bacterium]|nr:AarF/UbiB family protein [Anaerolineae bacterium]
MTNDQRTAEDIQRAIQDQLSNTLSATFRMPGLSKVDPKRYRKIRWWFAKAFLNVIFWDIVLNRPVLRWFRTPPLPRWQRIARSFRYLAIEMGGVLIKLGQFLSIRVDVLPPEVTTELAGLQDEIPPEPMAKVLAQLEEDFGRPVTEVFEWFRSEPLGAASLAQVHLAKLPDGEEVVVKILRPGIDVLVETDLAVLGLAMKWLKLYRRISSRVDLDWLTREFTTITLKELDFEAEGKNAEQFAADFAADPGVYVPKVYWEYSAKRTLTLENVGFLKITDLEALAGAGIQRDAVARKFYNVFMEQVFVNNFVHADPHPGNVFVKPLPHPDEPADTIFKPGEPVPYRPNRPFQVVFVDYGMMVTIPQRLRASLREYVIGIGTLDAYRVVKSYEEAGVLLPSADRKRIEEATADVMRRTRNIRIGQMKDFATAEAEYFFREYRDLIYEAPFQFPVDLIYTFRAIGILTGMSTNLDPDFDPWSETIPFAERLAQDEVGSNWRDWLQEAVALGQLALRLPTQAERILTTLERGDITVQTTLAPPTRRQVQRLEQSLNRLTYVVLAMGLLLTGGNLYTTSTSSSLGGWLMLAAGGVLVWGWLRERFS